MPRKLRKTTSKEVVFPHLVRKLPGLGGRRNRCSLLAFGAFFGLADFLTEKFPQLIKIGVIEGRVDPERDTWVRVSQ